MSLSQNILTKTRKLIPARLVNYSINILFNTGLFFLIFSLGDIKIKFFFNKLDLMTAIIPLFLSLGIERVFPFEQNGFNSRQIFSNLFFIISIITLIIFSITLIINIDYVFAVFLGFIYSYANLSVNIMIISNDFNKKFIFENTIKLVFLSLFTAYVYFTETRLSINSLITLFVIITTFLLISNYKIFLQKYDLKSFAEKYIYKSKYILYLILLGTFFGNIPRIFEIFFGTEDLSVKFFFWIKLIAYLSALGMLYNYIILRYLIKDEGFLRVKKSAIYSLIIYAIIITFLNFLNAKVDINLFLENRITPIYLVIFCLTTFLGYIKDLYIENLMSINLDFRKKFIIFFKVVFFNLCFSTLLYYLNYLNAFSVLTIMFLSSIYWFFLGLSAIEHSLLNKKFLIKAILIFVITGIINTFFFI